MKTILLQFPADIDKNPLSSGEVAVPEPSDEEVLVKVIACGVCHTDLHIAEGELLAKSYPVILGHQVIGIVEKTGSNTKNSKKGDRVGIGWINGTCGSCFFCKNNIENLCDSAEFTGFTKPGGFTEYICVSENFAFKINEKQNAEKLAPLMCAGVIGYRAFKLSETKLYEHLGLFGFGSSAHIVIQVAKHFKCNVSVFTRSPEHKKLAEKLGADWVGGIDENPPTLLDRAITFAPAGSIIPKALEKIRKAGTLVINAVYLDTIHSIDYPRHLYFEKTIRSVTSYTRRDAIEFLELADKIHLKTEIQTFKLDEVNKVLQMLKKGQITGAGVIVL